MNCIVSRQTKLFIFLGRLPNLCATTPLEAVSCRGQDADGSHKLVGSLKLDLICYHRAFALPYICVVVHVLYH